MAVGTHTPPPPVAVRRPWFRRPRNKEALAALLFLAPNLIGFLVLTLGPGVFSLIMGFTNWSGISRARWVGAENYIELLADKVFLTALRNTLVYTVEFTPLVIGASLLFALLFNQRAWGVPVVRLLCFLPIVTDFISVAFIWSWIYHFRFGVLNWALGLLNLPAQAWLGDVRWAMLALVVMSVWRWVGYYAIILLAGLQGIPSELKEAATIDGANGRQLFLRVTIPLLSPALFFVLIISISSSLAVFEQMYIMTQGGPRDSTISISMFLYQQGFRFFKMGYASAVAWILFLLTFMVTAFNWTIRRRWVYQE